MKHLLALVILVLAASLCSAQAQSPDDQYVGIYALLQQADALNASGQSSQALEKYLQAQSNLQRLQKVFPDWNPKVVNFRLTYLEGKISTLTAKTPVPAATAPTTDGTRPAQTVPQGTPAVVLSEADRKLAALENEVRQLNADKTVLDAKLREALATQPAAIDPRELVKAEEKIQSLMKENDLLKVAMTKQQGESGQGIDQKTLDEARQALTEANRKLADQSARARALASEKESLQKQLDELAAKASNTTQLDEAKAALAAANTKLVEQSGLAQKLTSEKDALESRLQAVTAGAEAAEALRAENRLLKNQLAELKTAASTAGASPDQSNQLAQAQARLAALQSDAGILRLEKAALQNRVSEASTIRDGSAERIKRLERERDDLRKKLAATEKGGLFRRRSKASTTTNKELSDQLESFRSQLAVLTARAVPYTTEELALFQKPETQLAAATVDTSGRSSQEPPPGTTALAAEAQRLFAGKQYEKAEQKYLEILRQEQSNVYTLANLAAIQLEMGRLDESEKNVKQALASAPNDAYSLSLLGYLKFRQEKYDDAFDALSRAAALEPQNAEVQNYLGVTLSHKGMRGPAETALRKAIQLEPSYGSAHNNLAVIYATQQPPLKGLARWHYQKARAAGHARNEDLEKMLDQKVPDASPVAP